MVIAFANNQSLTTVDAQTSTITTDPVSMEGYDRATANFNIHYLWKSNGGNATITYQGQVSNDGTNWWDVPTLTDSETAATSGPQQQVVPETIGAFIRFVFSFSLSGAGSSSDTAGVGFDLHVLLDHT